MLDTPIQVFSCECCENFKNTYFEEHLRTAASDSFLLISTINSNGKFLTFSIFYKFQSTELHLMTREVDSLEAFLMKVCKRNRSSS